MTVAFHILKFWKKKPIIGLVEQALSLSKNTYDGRKCVLLVYKKIDIATYSGNAFKQASRE